MGAPLFSFATPMSAGRKGCHSPVPYTEYRDGRDCERGYDRNNLEHQYRRPPAPFLLQALGLEVEPIAAIAGRPEDSASDQHFELRLMNVIRRLVSDCLIWIERASAFEMLVNLPPGARD